MNYQELLGKEVYIVYVAVESENKTVYEVFEAEIGEVRTKSTQLICDILNPEPHPELSDFLREEVITKLGGKND